jgi:hypothetical protein
MILHEWSRFVMLCNEILYIIGFYLYTFSMSLFDATYHNLKFSHIIYMFSIFTAEHILRRIISDSNDLKRITSYY